MSQLLMFLFSETTDPPQSQSPRGLPCDEQTSPRALLANEIQRDVGVGCPVTTVVIRHRSAIAAARSAGVAWQAIAETLSGNLGRPVSADTVRGIFARQRTRNLQRETRPRPEAVNEPSLLTRCAPPVSQFPKEDVGERRDEATEPKIRMAPQNRVEGKIDRNTRISDTANRRKNLSEI